MKAQPDVFGGLADPIRRILKEIGLSKPTDPQVAAIPFVLAGENILLVAPTGSGKTEAVMLPVFSKLLAKSRRQGIRVLYITPLRALNRDMIKRMSIWASKLNLSIQVRHGDTETKIRRRQAIEPPEILVTTPETLQAILPGSRMQEHLRELDYVVIDEIHEMAGNKRGAQLSVALERLDELSNEHFQRIGLSATVENPQKIASFIGGSRKPVRVVVISQQKNYDYRIEYPTPTDRDYDLAQTLKTAPEAVARIRRMLELAREHKSALIFVNSRTNAEMLGHKFSQLTDDIEVHHGSLSKDERKRTEEAFKASILKAIVCTSTLELGLDIGQVDLVIQYLSPRQVGSLIQRVGRSGHRLDLVSKGIIITAFSEDVLESLAVTMKAMKEQLEPTLVHENALDVLAHQIAGILMNKRVATLQEVLTLLHHAYPFRTLSKTKLLEVAEYLDTIRIVKLEGETLRRAGRTRSYYYQNLSMIPDERRYPIVDILSDRRIGTLGDEFVSLRARVGLNFICKGKVWRIVQIEDQTGTIYVIPSEDKFAAIPGWDGEMLPVTFELASQVGNLRERIAKELKRNKDTEVAAERLAQELRVEKAALLESVQEIEAHVKENLPVPTTSQILLEAFEKYIIIHACFGEIVNRTLGSVLDAQLSNRELIVGWWNDGYRLLIETPRRVEPGTLAEVAGFLKLTSKEVDTAFNDYLEARFPFASKMKAVAERFGAMPRGKTISWNQLRDLPARFRNTPVYEETIREALIEKVDLPAVKQIVKDVRKGKIKVSKLLRLEKPTPLAYHIFTKYSEVAELIAPDQVLLSNIERMKRLALSRTVRLFCLTCGSPAKETRIRELPEKPLCEKCSSGLLAILTRKQNHHTLKNLIKRREEGGKLLPEELNDLSYARRTADLILSHGKKAVVAIKTKGVGPETAFRILGKMHPNEDDFYMDLLKAKINYIKTSPFWKDREQQSIRYLRAES